MSGPASLDVSAQAQDGLGLNLRNARDMQIQNWGDLGKILFQLDQLDFAVRSPIGGTKEQEEEPILTAQSVEALLFAGLINQRNLWCSHPRLQADNMLAGCTW